MTARVVTIGNQKWVAGMSWRTFEDTPSKTALLNDAEPLKASWAAVRIGEDAIQAGFCAAIEGEKPSKLRSLAAMMADSRRQPWLGIFKIEEGVWWYIAVRDGHAILPDGDVIGGEQEITDAQDRHSGYTDWQYVKGDLEYLEELLSEIHAKPTRLKSLEGGDYGSVKLAASALAVVGIVAGGAYWWHAKKEADERARLAAIAQFRAQLASSAPPPVAAPAVPAYPQPGDWLRACNEIISPLPLSDRGWLIDQVGCDSTSVVVRRVITDGATVANRPEGEVFEQGDAIQQRIALTGVKPSDGKDSIELVEAKLAARAWAQSGGHQLTFAAPAQPPVLPGASAPKAAPPTQVGVVIEMSVSPFRPEMQNGLANLPGLRLTQMKSTDTGWHIEGVIYGR